MAYFKNSKLANEDFEHWRSDKTRKPLQDKNIGIKSF